MSTVKENKPGYKKTKLGWIPEDWQEDTLESVIRLVSGQHLASDQYWSERIGVPYFTGPSDFANTETKVGKWTTIERKFAKSGDVLLTVKGSGVGVLFMLDLEKVVMGRQLMALRGISTNGRYLYYVLQTRSYHFQRLASGNMIPGLSREDILKTHLIFPPLPEQRAIARILSTWDRAIDTLQKLITKKQERKKGLMQQLLTGKKRFPRLRTSTEFEESRIGLVPKDWKVLKLGEIGDFKNGINKSKEDFGHGIPFVNLMDVFGKQVVKNLDLSLVNATEREVENYSLLKGDVLFVRSSVKPSGVGLTSLVDKDLRKTVYSGFLIRFRETEKILNHDFKKYCFYSDSFRNRLIKKSSVSANTNINQQSLQKLRLAIPRVEEQQKIASVLSAADREIEKLQGQLEKVQEQKKGLMQKLLTGEVRTIKHT